MDPLKQAMASADNMRRQVNTMMRRGSRGIKAALPAPPEGFPIDLPVIPDFELPALPALPTNGLPVPPTDGFPAPPEGFPALPTNGFPALPTLPELPVFPTEPTNAAGIPVPSVEIVDPEMVTRSVERQIGYRPLNHAGIGRRF